MKPHLIAKQLILALVLVLIHKPGCSQSVKWFSYQKNTQAYIAEMHSPSNKLELVKLNKLHPFYYKNNATERPFLEVQMGYQLPVLSFEKQLNSGQFQLSFCAPVSILTLVDMFERETAPVINTDYRFGAKLFFVFTPDKENSGFLKNYYLTYVPVFHESTHIGDEFALHGYNQIPDFARINVSYEAWKLIAGINKCRNEGKDNLSAEVGYQRLMPYKDGYYNVDSLEVKGADIIASDARDVWFARVEYSHSFTFNNELFTELVASSDVRRDIRFGYTPDEPEKRVWSVNVYVGCRFPLKNTKRKIGVYYRHYRGIVPYGQLRDQDDFVLNGLSVVFD
jgi:hypothetical protein